MKPRLTAQKLRGGYYTPAPVARFLAEWAVRAPQDRVLEPSCGDGAFLEEVASALRRRGAEPAAMAQQITAVELDAAEAAKARARLQRLGVEVEETVRAGDFFSLCSGALAGLTFDAVVGNPPFVRYQNFPAEHREPAFALMRAAGMNPNGLTNAWVPFVCIAATMLAETGRLAMVIPAELLQVSYSAELRRFLSQVFARVTLFTFRELLFDGVQQEVVLLRAEKASDEARGIDIIELTGADELERHAAGSLPRGAYKPMDHSSEKWTQYFLSRHEVALLRALRTRAPLPRLGDLASVDVGIVTGLNEFFVLPAAETARRKLTAHAHPVVTRSAQLAGLVHAETPPRSHLLTLPDAAFTRLPAAVKRHVREGEARGYHLGYKCRIRKRWWVLPSVWAPDAFLLRQIHRHPKLTVNQAGATCTDTIHRVRMRNGTAAQTLAAAFINSLTFAFAEVLGRSYGGGVLELEPSEAESLPVPMSGSEALDLGELDRLLLGERVDDALALTDRVLLIEGLGLSAEEVRLLRGIWQKLMQRRIERRPTQHRQPAAASASNPSTSP